MQTHTHIYTHTYTCPRKHHQNIILLYIVKAASWESFDAMGTVRGNNTIEAIARSEIKQGNDIKNAEE